MNKNNQKKIIIGSIVLVAILVAITTYVLSRHAPSYTTAVASTRNLTQVVRTNGTVSADQSSVLSFSTQGKIQSVLVSDGDVVKQGQTLAYLDAGTIRAELDGALADLSSAQAQLTKLQNGTRPEELAIVNQKYSDASSALIVAMNNAYLQASDSILNKADTFFTNGNSVNPVINIRTQSQSEQTNINTERVALNDALHIWKINLNNISNSTSSINSARNISQKTLLQTQTFLNDLSAIVSNLSPGNSGLSQTIINSYLATINSAQQEQTGASNAYTTADASYSSARDGLALSNAGSQSEDLTSQSALVAKAQAQVDGYRSALEQSIIVAPFDGTITDVNMKVGEVVVPGISADENINIINTNLFNIDTYVPENDIGSIKVGDDASVSLDAYGQDTVFPASVYLVSPAETIQNGINSYKVTLRFKQPDERIRSGLTANVIITTATATLSLAIPSRAIITKNYKTFILLKDGNDYTQTEIMTGIKSADGYTQVLSGLKNGDTIASFGSDNY